MYAYYIVRGKDLNELINMPYADKLFYYASMEIEAESKAEFYSTMLGGGEK